MTYWHLFNAVCCLMVRERERERERELTYQLVLYSYMHVYDRHTATVLRYSIKGLGTRLGLIDPL